MSRTLYFLLSNVLHKETFFFNSMVVQVIFIVTINACRFANGPGDLGSIPGRVIPKTLKMVLDASLLNTQH